MTPRLHLALPLLLAAAGCGDATGPSQAPAEPQTLAAGGHHICRLDPDGVATCWGRADAGQLGADSTPRISLPARVATTLRFRSIVAGAHHTCALTGEGEAWCWGLNDAGQLGSPADGLPACWREKPCSATPVRVGGGLRFARLVAGGGSTCGFTGEGQVWCWGADGAGQLGVGGAGERCGGVACSTVPLRLPDQPRFRDVVLGGGHSCGLTGEGEAWCWGSNAEGQLGTGAGDGASRPVRVAGGRRYLRIAAGGLHTCALAGDGKPWCWGADILPPDGTGASRSDVPVAIAGSPPFVHLFTGTWAACGRAADGRLSCWGINAWGEVGTTPMGYNTRFPTPVPVSGNHRFRAAAGHFASFCGLEGEQVWCWGHADYGELGAVRVHSPVPVPIE